MTGIVYTTASLVLTVMEHDPLQSINLFTMNLLLTQLEFSLSAFASHRVRLLQTPSALITEIDNYTPSQTPILLPVKTKFSQPPNGEHFKDVKSNSYEQSVWSEMNMYPDALYPGYGGKTYTLPSEQDYYNALEAANNITGSYSMIGDRQEDTPRSDIKCGGSLPYGSDEMKISKILHTSEARVVNGHVGTLESAAVILDQKSALTEKASQIESSEDVNFCRLSPFVMVCVTYIVFSHVF